MGSRRESGAFCASFALELRLAFAEKCAPAFAIIRAVEAAVGGCLHRLHVSREFVAGSVINAGWVWVKYAVGNYMRFFV